MNTRDLSPGMIVAVVAVVVAIIGFFLWRGTSVQPYTGPPINMGAAMAGGQKGAAPPPGSTSH